MKSFTFAASRASKILRNRNWLFGDATAIEPVANILGLSVTNTLQPFVASYSIANDPSSTSLSSRRMIFPEDVMGTESTNWIPRGTL